MNNLPCSDHSLEVQIYCVEQELDRRTRIFTKALLYGGMSADKAHKELNAMRAVLHTLKGLQREEVAT